MKPKVNIEEIDFKIFNKDNVLEDEVRKEDYRNYDDDIEKKRENLQLLELCSLDYDSLEDFRDRTERAFKYRRGDQWHELMDNPDYNSSDADSAQTISEETYILNQGKVPIKQNIIAQVVKNVIGQFRSNPSKIVVTARDREEAKRSEMLSAALQANNDVNMTNELDARNLEMKTISGAVVSRLCYRPFPTTGRWDIFEQNVNPARVFYNADIEDVRLFDIVRIGQLLDVTLDDVISQFAQDDDDVEKIKSWYQGKDIREIYDINGLDSDRIFNLDFYNSQDESKCRVFEIWYQKYEWKITIHDLLDAYYGDTDMNEEEIAFENQKRIMYVTQQGLPPDQAPLIEITARRMAPTWYYKYLTPYGDTLAEGKTPYKHGEHPFVMVLYPLLHGEVWGLVEEIIDQQRYINRLITLLDFIMSSSAKGVLLLPEDAIPDNMSPEDFAEEWTKFNGVITYRSKPGVAIPQQISTNSTNIGATDLLMLQMKLIQDISGVSNAIQGQQPKSGTPSSLYAQQAQNSMLNVKDFLESFNWFIKKKNIKKLKLIQQFYTEKVYLNIAGRNYSEEARMYDPALVGNIDFDVVVSQGTDTPVYRQIIDDMLTKLLDMSLITLEEFLQHSSMPFADALLETIRKRQGQGQVSPEMMAQMQSQISKGQGKTHPMNPLMGKLLKDNAA